MIEFNIENNLAEFQKGISAVYQDQIPFASALALQWTGRDVQKEMQSQIRSKLNKVKLRSVLAIQFAPKKVDKANPFVRIFLDDTYNADKWMEYLLQGGTRKSTGAEYHMRQAGLIRKDQYLMKAKWKGKTKIRGGEVTRMLSQFKAFNAAGVTANASKVSNKRGKKKSKSKFYLMQRPHDADVEALIMRKVGKKAKPMYAVMAEPHNEMKVNFYGIAQKIAEERVLPNFQKAFELARRTAR